MANYVIGAADANSGVAATPAAPLAGKTVVVPAYTDTVDGPKAFIDFANSLPEGGAPLATALPLAGSTPAKVGTGTNAARSDHQHLSDLPLIAGAAPAVTELREGTMWWDSGTGDLFILFGTQWVQVGGGGGGPQHTISQADPTPADGADGDIWIVYKP